MRTRASGAGCCGAGAASITRRDAQEAAQLEAALASSGDDRLRRVGLAVVVAQAETGRGWDDDLLGRLHTFRADPSPLVAAAAQFTLPPEDQAEPAAIP